MAPHPLRSALGIGLQGCGVVLLPFLVALPAAALFDVREVADTSGALTALALIFILPPMAMQVLATLVKVGRERRLLLRAGQRGLGPLLASVHRHMRILTARGWGALVTGLLFIALALGAKWASLGLLAVLSLLLFYSLLGLSSLASLLMVRNPPGGLGREESSIRRELSPAVVQAGEAAEERFLLTRVAVPPGFTLVIQDDNPPPLRTESRYAVGAGARRSHLTLSGRFRATPRGLHRLGPAEIRFQDALGFTSIAVASLATATLKVLPRFRSLAVLEPPRSRLQAPDLLTLPHRQPTDDPFRFKEYHAGDDTRRIHWRLSIRTGRLQVREPETREVSTRQVILLLDTWMPPGRLLEDAIGLHSVLDALVETWISLAKRLRERGDRVILMSAVPGPGGVEVEVLGAQADPRRWQDLGARVAWQGALDVHQVLAAGLGQEKNLEHGLAVSSRFFDPPPASLAERSFTWVYLPPLHALGPDEPPWWRQWLGGSSAGLGAFKRLLLLPGPAGADENRFLVQVQEFASGYRLYQARKRLRWIARQRGEQTLTALLARGEALYRLEPSPGGVHRLIGVQAGAA